MRSTIAKKLDEARASHLRTKRQRGVPQAAVAKRFIVGWQFSNANFRMQSTESRVCGEGAKGNSWPEMPVPDARGLPSLAQ